MRIPTKTLAFGLASISTLALAHDTVVWRHDCIDLHRTEKTRTTVGSLNYLGGLEFNPGQSQLGGVSSLVWSENRLFAVTDEGHWLSFKPLETSEGELKGITSLQIGPLHDRNGAPLTDDFADAEGLARHGDVWLVSFEREHRILRYQTLNGRALGKPRPTSDNFPNFNSGAEAIAFTDDGVEFCAQSPEDHVHKCWQNNDLNTLLSMPSTRVGDGPEMRLTDMAIDSAGVRYSLFHRFANHRNEVVIKSTEINENTSRRTDRTLATMSSQGEDNGYNLHAFEGIAIREENRCKFLYLITDDNFQYPNDKQRTLLMKFEIQRPAGVDCDRSF